MTRAAPRWLRGVRWLVGALPFGRYRLVHALGRVSIPPFVAEISSPAGRVSFLCDLRDGISREVFLTGQYEPQETAILLSLIRPGSTFVDVGANWGYYTLLAARRVGPAGRVIAVEPDPRMFAVLDANVRRNGFDWVTASRVAALDQPGEATLLGFDETAGNFGTSTVGGADDRHDVPRYRVATAPLDAILAEARVDTVHVMKVDVEGAEVAVLRGLAQHLARASVDRLLLELHPTLLAAAGYRVEDATALLHQYGYRGWRIDHSPAVARAAYYGHRQARCWIRPLGEEHDPWPHQLWVRPGLDPLEVGGTGLEPVTSGM